MSVPLLNITARRNLRTPLLLRSQDAWEPARAQPGEPMTLAAYTGVLTLAHRQMIAGIRDQWAGTVLSTAPVDRAATLELRPAGSRRGSTD
jgi:hypothetical protein